MNSRFNNALIPSPTLSEETTCMPPLHRLISFISNSSVRARLTKQFQDAGRTSRERTSVRNRGARTEDAEMRRVRHALTAAVSVVLIGAGAFLTATPAQAASGWWQVSSGAQPSHLADEAGAEGQITVFAENVGNTKIGSESSPIVASDSLPPGLEALEIKGVVSDPGGFAHNSPPIHCSLADLTCVVEGTYETLENHEFAPFHSVSQFGHIELLIKVKVLPGANAEELDNHVTISGGGAPAASLTQRLTLTDEPAAFGIEQFRLSLQEEGGDGANQAASHPFQVTAGVGLDRGPEEISPFGNGTPVVAPSALAKDVHTELPPGLVGDPTSIPACTLARFLTLGVGLQSEENLCPAESALGVASVKVDEPGLGTFNFTEPVFNLEPSYGEPARFGFYIVVSGTPVVLDASLRDGEGQPGSHPDYGIDVDVDNITQTAGLLDARVTFWGTPGAAVHGATRGWGCLREAQGTLSHTRSACEPKKEQQPPAFLTMPSSCSGPLQASILADSWAARGAFERYPLTEPLPTLDGCNRVPFGPTVASEPTSDSATTGTGLNFDINFANEGLHNSNEGALAESEVKKAVVVLPEGFTSNPSVAAGLKACSEAEYEASTVQIGSGCTEESKIGEVELESPLVEPVEPITGSLFVARQGENPNHNLLTLYMVVQSPELGIMIKQPLKVTPNPVTGQLTTEVDEIPQLPFSHFRLKFRSGQRSPLITPPACGTYTVRALLYPWSEPATPREETSSFKITQGPEGQGCPSGGTPPFHPGLEAGTVNNAAGTYSPFYTHISRKDSEQEITRFSIKLPTGLIARLKGVSECSDAQVAAAKAREHEGGATEEEASPSCPKNSEVGHSTVGTGVGSVLAYAGGKLYLAGPYHGSPISLVSVSYAKVGPFDLGTVVVRFAIDVNHETAEVSVDGANSDPIPHIVDGIPIHLRDIRAYVDRPGFTLNPTSCAKKSTAATVLGSGADFASSSDDVPVTVSSPFQAADCASLGFKPKLSLSLTGKKTHRGALPAFKAVLTYPQQGAYANIAKAQVTLPNSEILEQGHLKDVCTRKVFETGVTPGENCPAKSIYGHARAITPLLEAPLEGPVYLRTGYGTRLPELAAALNGPQISVTLAGKIDSVHKKGSELSRIRNTFEAVPDAPVEKFVLELKGGNKGLLVNSTEVCKGTHKALAAFTGQNGKIDEYEPALTAQCGKGKKKSGAKTKGKGAKGKGGK